MANGNRLEIGHSFQALYHNVGELATEGTAVVSGCSPSASATRDWGVDVTAGTVSRSWEFTDLEDTDVIVWDGNDYRVVKGDAVAHSSRQTNGEARFELIRPEPDALANNDWVPIAEVFVATGATEITDDDIHGLTEDPLPKGVPDDTKFYLGTDREYSIRRDSDSGEVILVDEQNGHEWRWNHDGAGGLKFPGELAAESADVDSASVDSLDASVDTAVPLEIGPFELYSDGGDLIIHAPWTGNTWRFDGNDGGLESADISSLDLDSLSLTDLDVDNFAAAMELVAPRYDSTSAAPDKTGMIIVVPTSGSDTAGAYIHNGNGYQLLDESGGVSAGSLSGLSIDADKDWGGHHIENVGSDGVRVPEVQKRTVADFETGFISSQPNADSSYNYRLISSGAKGEFSLLCDADSAGWKPAPDLTDDVETYPQPGDSGSWYVKMTDSDDRLIINFAEGTKLLVQSLYSSLILRDGNDNDVDSETVSFENYLNEWIELDWDWQTDRTMTVTAKDSSGNALGTVSGVTNYYQPRVSLSSNNPNSPPTIYYDMSTLYRRETEGRPDTARGSTFLGNDVQPSGNIGTGPQEAPANAERTVRTIAPVNADATQGTQAELRDEIAGTPAGRYRYTHDGQGGAYGSRFDAALGRVARVNANLSWEYDTLADVPAWSADDGGESSWTYTLTARPRRIHIEHDGSGSAMDHGGVITSCLTSYDSLGAFRVTFKDVSFTYNADGGNLMQLGITDSTPSTHVNSHNNAMLLRGSGSSGWRLELFESGTSTFSTGGTQDWTTLHDVTIEYDGSESRLYVDGVLHASLSTSITAPFSPMMQIQQDDSESVGETLEVGQIIVEAIE